MAERAGFSVKSKSSLKIKHLTDLKKSVLYLCFVPRIVPIKPCCETSMIALTGLMIHPQETPLSGEACPG